VSDRAPADVVLPEAVEPFADVCLKQCDARKKRSVQLVEGRTRVPRSPDQEIHDPGQLGGRRGDDIQDFHRVSPMIVMGIGIDVSGIHDLVCSRCGA